MNAPQIVMIILLAISGTVNLLNDGKPRKNYSFIAWLIATSIKVGILYWGGFFN